jgi:hypothetical protein
MRPFLFTLLGLLGLVSLSPSYAQEPEKKAPFTCSDYTASLGFMDPNNPMSTQSGTPAAKKVQTLMGQYLAAFLDIRMVDFPKDAKNGKKDELIKYTNELANLCRVYPTANILQWKQEASESQGGKQSEYRLLNLRIEKMLKPIVFQPDPFSQVLISQTATSTAH